jgi:hypothetical protein
MSVSVAKPALRLGRLRAAAIALELLLGVGAVGGGIALMAGPNGEILPLPVSALGGSPFANYFAPGGRERRTSLRARDHSGSGYVRWSKSRGRLQDHPSSRSRCRAQESPL